MPCNKEDNKTPDDNELIKPEEMAYRLEAEGIGYAILNYYGKIKSNDKTAENLWNNAHDAIVLLQTYLDLLDKGS